MRYRPEVDGLRAVAVVPVILFHAGFEAFAGGFVGVDVFFVISGYLITTILANDLDRGTFRIATFYERRARRILPALFLVIACTVPFAAAWLAPPDLEDFSQSLGAVTVFSSNVLFWLESGYFDTANELKPLLHTWSLAVEEQYYIFFPLALRALWGRGRRVLLVTLGMVFVASLGLAELGSRAWPAAAFYLLPTRAWELMVGAFVALHLRAHPLPFRAERVSEQLGSALGLAMIAASIVAYDARTPFPGVYALLPTVGTALVLRFAIPGTWVAALLSTPPFVLVGLISYSAYLWHQPILALARYRSPEPLSGPTALLLGAASLVLAYLSWRWVEAPFRHRARTTRGQIAAFSLVGSLAILALGVAGHATDGFRSLVLAARAADGDDTYHRINRAIEYVPVQHMEDDGACRFWSPRVDDALTERFAACAARHGDAVVLLGDSHGLNLHNAFARSGEVPFLVGLAREGSRPHDPGRHDDYAELADFVAARAGQIRAALYHQSGSYLLVDAEGRVDSQRVFDEGGWDVHHEHVDDVARYLARLHRQSGVPVYWIGPFPEYRRAPTKALFSSRFHALHPESSAVFSALEDHLVAHLEAHDAIEYVRFDRLYDVPERVLRDDCFLFHDADHFSRCGEDRVAAAPGVRAFLAAL